MKIVKIIFSNTFKFVCLCILCVLYLLAILFCSPHAYASDITTEELNSLVVKELMQSETFDINSSEWNTPLIKYNEYLGKYVEYNYGFKLITIGYDDKRELYIYTCQPKFYEKVLTASSINIFYDNVDNFEIVETYDNKIMNYELELVSRGGRFDKYYVKGFNSYTHSNEDLERYINFISIFRPYDKSIDKDIDVGSINDKSFPIGEKWRVKEINGYISYSKAFINYLEITPTISSHGLFYSGFSFKNLFGFEDGCELWYFAFNIENYDVKNILDVSINFNIEKWREYVIYSPFSENNMPNIDIFDDEAKSDKLKNRLVSVTNETIKISNTQEGIFKPTGWFDRKDFRWNRICRPNELIEVINSYHGDFNENDKNILLNSDWVFNYFETSYFLTKNSHSFMGGGSVRSYDKIVRSRISKISPITIKFIDNNGNVHNLGVVSDKFTSSSELSFNVDSDIDNWFRLFDEFSTILSILTLIILLVFLCTVSSVLSPIITLIKLVFKSLIFVISMPFKIIKWIFVRK